MIYAGYWRAMVGKSTPHVLQPSRIPLSSRFGGNCAIMPSHKFHDGSSKGTVYTPYSSMPWSMIGNFVDTTGIKIIRSPDIFMYMPERVSTSNKDNFCDRRSCVSLNEIFTSKRRGICTASTQKSSHTLLIYTIYLYTFEINI